jgi:polyisoprenoid-binding protein YceI
MRSLTFNLNVGNNFIGMLNLTIKGKTKLIEVSFTYNESAGTALFRVSFKINRNDFNIGGKSMVLADDATVNIVVETAK